MRKLLFALAWTVVCLSPAFGQCTGVFPPNTLCGNLSGTAQPPRAFPSSGTVVGPGSSLFHGLPIWGNSAGNSLVDGNGQSIPGVYTFLSATTFQGPVSATGNFQVGGSFIAGGAITATTGPIVLSATTVAISNGSGPVSLGGRTNTKNFNSTRYVSQYVGADWCAKLVAALADIGTNNPGTIVVDQSAGAAACTAASPISMTANKALYFVDGTDYILNQQLQVGTDSRIEGIGGGEPFVSPFISGTRLRWTGANNTAMVKVFGASHATIRDMGLACNNTTGCASLWQDSANNPGSTNNTYENLALTGFEKGIVIGLSATATISSGGCTANFAQSGCSQNDNFKIDNIHMVGNCGSTTATGIHINSQNAGQLSSIDRIGMQCTNVGVNIFNMNGNLRVSGASMGSVTGLSATTIQIHGAVQNGPMLVNNESEAGTYGLSSSAAGPMVWMYNSFNQAVNVSGSAASITSIGNIYNTLTISAGANFTSYTDVIGSYTVGGVTIFRRYGANLVGTVSNLPACVPQLRGQKFFVVDATATTFNTIVAGAGANPLTVGCDGTNWRIGN